MKIKDILDKKGSTVITIGPQRTAHDAIRVLCANRIGALVVTGEAGEIIGIVTERDVLHECGDRCSLMVEPARPETPFCPTLVQDIMTKSVIIGLASDSLDYVMGVMTQNRIRHLPVLEDNQLIGIVSIGDVVNAHLRETTYENRTLKDYIQGVATAE
jgi:CBS domain-containing protein